MIKKEQKKERKKERKKGDWSGLYYTIACGKKVAICTVY